MLDFDDIAGFDWDEGNDQKNAVKHGVSRNEAEGVFFNDPLIVAEDKSHSRNERRLNALGQTNDGRLLHITFTLRQNETLIRIISVRDMNRKERLVYGQA